MKNIATQYLLTLKALSEAYPYFLISFVGVLSTYIQTNNLQSPTKAQVMNYDRAISESAILIVKNCASKSEIVDVSVIEKIEQDLIHIINHGSLSSLSSAVETLCALIIHASKHFILIVQVFKKCFGIYF